MQLLPILIAVSPCSGTPYISEQVLVRPPGAYTGGPGQPFVAEERSLYFVVLPCVPCMANSSFAPKAARRSDLGQRLSTCPGPPNGRVLIGWDEGVIKDQPTRWPVHYISFFLLLQFFPTGIAFSLFGSPYRPVSAYLSSV